MTVIRRVAGEDWQRLRDVRPRALATDPDAFLETVLSVAPQPGNRFSEYVIG